MNYIFITELENLAEKLLTANSKQQIDLAKKVQNTLERVYTSPENSFNKRINVLIGKMEIKEFTGVVKGFNSNLAQELHDLITQAIYDLNKYKDVPQNQHLPTSINISNSLSQSQSQSQTQSVEILLETLENELTGKQYKELLALLKEKSEPEEKKNKIIEKLKSYGVDILAKVVSSTITNPEILASIIS